MQRACTVLLAGCLVLSACGGGGGGDDEDEEVVNLVATYNFAITNGPGAPDAYVRTETVASGPPDDVYSLDAGTGSIRGSFVRSSLAITIAAATTYTVDWTGRGPTPAAFTVSFTQDASFPTGNFLPSTGAFAVTWGTDTITVDYGNTVFVALNGGAPVGFTPFDFALLDSATSVAPDWQRVAARASGALLDVIAQVRPTAVLLEGIYDGEFDLGPVVVPCPAIPGSPPAGIPQVGDITTTDLGGDDYRTTATACFSLASGQTTGALFGGTLERRNLVSTVTNGLLTRAGFEGTASVPGGLVFDRSTRLLTESAPLVWTFLTAETRDSGGFSLVFTAP
jgi:hypothetical protein